MPEGGVTEPSRFVISQHGGGGTPELCSDFYGDTNYNHLTRRILSRGAVVSAASPAPSSAACTTATA